MKFIVRSTLGVFASISGALIFSGVPSAMEAEISWKIDESTAEHLAAEAYFGGDRGLKFFDYDGNMSTNFAPPFFVFNGLSKSPAEGSFGFFAVNPWTGDVWALWGCHRLSTPALRKSQTTIRRRFSPDEMKQYPRLRRLKPECIVED